jgi:hypothetical protein
METNPPKPYPYRYMISRSWQRTSDIYASAVGGAFEEDESSGGMVAVRTVRPCVGECVGGADGILLRRAEDAPKLGMWLESPSQGSW